MIRHSFTLNMTAAEALVAHRDGLPSFASDLPGLSRVQLVSRTDQGPVRILKHHWQGDMGVLPTPIRSRVRPEHMAWTDHSRWNASTVSGEWEVHVPILGDGAQIRGVHRFSDIEGGCRVDVDAELSFAADSNTRLLGIRVGPFLAPLLTRAISRLFTRMITHSGQALSAFALRNPQILAA